jgi:hypothetical protein
VVQRHRYRGEALTAVGTDRSVLLEEPSPSLGVSDATGRVRGELQGPVRRTAFGALLPTSSPGPLRPWMVVVWRQDTAMVMVRRTALEGALLGPFVAIGRIVKISRQN